MNPTPIGPVKKRFALTTVIAIILVTALTSFILGTRANDIMAWAGSGQNRDLASDLDFSGVEEVYDKLREKYDGKLDPAALIEGAKKGLVEATGDPYTSYFSQEEAKAFMSDLEGSFSGIGAELDKREGQLLVVSTLDDSPARKSGLQANDQIVKVNDQDTTDWSIDEAVSQIRGEKGTTVKLTVVRSQEIKDFSIIRDAIVAPSVKWEITNDNVGYLRISRFAESSTTELATKAAREFKDKNVKGVVLDLRGNGGGYLKAAQDIASLWLDDKVIVEERGDGKSDKLRSGGNPILGGMPTVVLVDGGSASASEIVAGALHDNDAAQLVGVKTFGKGSVQELVDLPGGAALKVTIAKWFTPTGKNITEEGIEPEIKVELSNDDLANKRDPQKDRAFELLR